MFDPQASFKRIRESVLNEFDISQVADWIEKNTKHAGRPFSFVGREYQQRILQSEAPTVVVKKCSQVGISELGFRRALGLCDIIDGFSMIYTLPTTIFANKVSKTRIDPIIETSHKLQSKISRQVDSAGVKRIGNSYLYVSGTYSVNDVISVPADAITVDEYDFSDPVNVENLQSRLTASKYRWWFYLSTPTIPNFGIDAKFQTTKRYYNWCKCHHCNHWYLPDYLKHVRIPDFDNDLLSITAAQLGQIRWKEAQLYCPHCHKAANLLPQHRAWVCENPADLFDADGFQVNPFDAPTIISPADLVLWSTRFKRKVNFVNYHLGQVMADAESGLNDNDLNKMEQVGQRSLHGFKVFGLDMGTTCHLIVGVTDGQGKLTIIAKHPVDYRYLEEQLKRYIAQYRPTTIVADSQPYVETIHRLQNSIYNLYGAVYIQGNDTQPFRVITQSEDKQKSLLDKRQVNINRNVAFNILMDDIRAGQIGVTQDAQQDTFRQHLKDMKRTAQKSSAFDGESSDSEPEAFRWVKTTGNDHYHHALLYCHIAAQMVHHLPEQGTFTPYINTFRLK